MHLSLPFGVGLWGVYLTCGSQLAQLVAARLWMLSQHTLRFCGHLLRRHHSRERPCNVIVRKPLTGVGSASMLNTCTTWRQCILSGEDSSYKEQRREPSKGPKDLITGSLALG